MGKFLVNIVAAGLMVSGAAQADMPLSEQDKDQIIGEYSYVGPFSDTTINVALEFYKNDDNELQAGGKVRAKIMPEGQWIAEELHTFRLLSAKEWAEEWKVTELSGKRCDEDRLCVVAVDNSTLNGEEYGTAMRLMQFESDFSSFQSYTVPKKGEPGYLGVIIKKKVGAQEISGAPSKPADGIEPDQAQASLASLQLEIELEFWKSVERVSEVPLYQAYLDKFPDGVFAPIAKLRIQQIEKSKKE